MAMNPVHTSFLGTTRSLYDLLGDACHTVLELLSRDDLVSLCLVSRPWRQDAEAHLYSTFEHTDQPFPQDDCPMPTLERFLRTILYRPQLGHYTRTLLLKGDYTDVGQLQTTRPLKSGYFLLGAMRTVDDIDRALLHGCGFATEWKYQLAQGSRDACLALLVHLLPNLRVLKLGDVWNRHIRLFSRFMNLLPAGRTSPTLQCLTLFTVDKRGLSDPNDSQPYQRGDAANVLSFFYIAGLSRLTAALANPATFTWPRQRAPDLSHVTFLNLRVIRECHLHHILKLTQRLRTFEYEWYYDLKDRHATNIPVIQLGTLADALALIQDTLVELTLMASAAHDGTVDDTWYESYPSLRIEGSLNRLQSFSQVRTIELPMLFLAAAWTRSAQSLPMADSIPVNASYVRISDEMSMYIGTIPPDQATHANWYGGNVVPELFQWSKVWSTTHPKLQTIRFISMTILKTRRETIFDIGRSTGIEIEVQYSTPEKPDLYWVYHSSDDEAVNSCAARAKGLQHGIRGGHMWDD